MFNVGSNGGKKIILFIPKIKLCQDQKKKKEKRKRRERNVMQISWKQTFYVPLLRDWTKQYKVYCTKQKQQMLHWETHCPFLVGSLKNHSKKKSADGGKWEKFAKESFATSIEWLQEKKNRRMHGIAGRSFMVLEVKDMCSNTDFATYQPCNMG